MPRLLPLYFLLFTLLGCNQKPEKYTYIAPVSGSDTEEQIIKKAANVIPSKRQLDWQKMEMTAFIHFGINTFYNQEWGHGDEDPVMFNPTGLDTDQWAKALSDAGMKMIIITAKHHDGFCLWPSKYTEHSVKNSPWKDGNGDVVGDLAESCKKYGLKLGVYLSPWDRNSQVYGTDEYNDYFVNQLTELLSNYGQVDEVWFDGANGEGPNGKKQVYSWDRYYQTIRDLQPQATIAVMGPDVRWVGTESGYGRDTEWSVLPATNLNTEMIEDISQNDAGIVPQGDKTEEDLGSRKKLKGATALVWYPSEVDVSIRPGWFYHESQDESVKTPEKLLDIYYSSIGKNSLLLLNIPPDTRGLIHENDVKSLKELRAQLDNTFDENLAVYSDLPKVLKDQNISTGKSLREGETLTLNFEEPVEFDKILLQENITVGQRMEEFSIEAKIDKEWKLVATGTTIGYKRILRTENIISSALRLTVVNSRLNPELAELGLFLSPPEVKITPADAIFSDTLSIELSSGYKDAEIYYSLTESENFDEFRVYDSPITISNNTNLYAFAKSGEKRGLLKSAQFSKTKYAVKLEEPFARKYGKRGIFTLIDGQKGSKDYNDNKWLGFEGNDLLATVDMGAVKSIAEISASFLENQKSWIFPPTSVEILYSTDGLSFSSIYSKDLKIEKREEVKIWDFSSSERINARYLKVLAKSVSTCPEFHEGSGSSCWLMVDEISIKE